VGIARKTLGAFRRNSSAISFVILVGFLAMMFSVGYHILAYDSSEFLQEPEAQEYENSVGEVVAMDEWERTKYYWSHNLRLAGLYVVMTPSYLSFHSSAFNGYSVGIATSYWYHVLGADANAALAFLAGIFVHGVLELTGVFIIAGATLRAAWNFWKGAGHMAFMTGKNEKTWSWRLSRRERKELRRYRGKVEGFLADFIILVGFGAFLIFLAGPIEVYVSPSVMAVFHTSPPLAVAFLVAIALLYISVFFLGFGGLRALGRDFRLMRRDIGDAFKLKWRSTHLSLLVFVAFSIIAATLFL